MVVLTIALVIDVMKPASLGFVVPGMRTEYAVSAATVAWLPFAALCGTVVGSVLWGVLADLYGRRASILLSAVMFVGTSICGAMPSLCLERRHVLPDGRGRRRHAAGHLRVARRDDAVEAARLERWCWSAGSARSAAISRRARFSALLQPIFGWRILWFLNLPTGLALIFLNVFIPESPKFLLALGRVAEAHAVLRRFGSRVREGPAPPARRRRARPRHRRCRLRLLIAQDGRAQRRRAGLGPDQFRPAALDAGAPRRQGLLHGGVERLLAASALIAVPTVFVAAWLYSRWSSKGALVGAIALCALGLLGVIHLELAGRRSPVLSIALLIVGINGIIAMLLPYAAESYPLQVRGRATGWVAACTKAGGLAAQLLGLLGLVPASAWAAVLALVPVLISLFLVVRYCAETRGRDLRDLKAGPPRVGRAGRPPPPPGLLDGKRPPSPVIQGGKARKSGADDDREGDAEDRADLADRLVDRVADTQSIRRQLRDRRAGERRQHHADADAGEEEAGQPVVQVVGIDRPGTR